MKTAFIFLTTGFEEIEAIAPVNILRRGGINVKTVSMESEKLVMGTHQIYVQADVLFDEIKDENADILILPGGMIPGSSVRIAEHKNLQQKISDTLSKGKSVAAICAAPMVLGQMGILKNKKATCYPGFEKYLEGAEIIDAPVVVDGNIITGKGPALAINFALSILEHLTDQDTRNKTAEKLIFN